MNRSTFELKRDAIYEYLKWTIQYYLQDSAMIKPLEEVTPIYDSVQAYVFVSCLSGLRSHRQSHRSLQIMETIRGIFFVILNQQVKTLAFLLFAGVPIKWEWKLIFLKEKSQFFSVEIFHMKWRLRIQRSLKRFHFFGCS